MKSLPIPFAIGQKVWWIGQGHNTRVIVCPECMGTKAVTMILGNGTEISLGCRACTSGFNSPTGTRTEIYYEHIPHLFICTDVRAEGRGEFRYAGGGHDYINSETLFEDHAECIKECDRLNEEKTQQERDRDLQNILGARKDMAWSAHYWTRKRSDLRKELESVERRLAAIKEIKKGESK